MTKFQLEYVVTLPAAGYAGEPDLAHDAAARKRWASWIASRGRREPFDEPELVSVDPDPNVENRYRLIYVVNLVEGFAGSPSLESDARARKRWAQDVAARGTKPPWKVPKLVSIREVAKPGHTQNDEALAELVKILKERSWKRQMEDKIHGPGPTAVEACLEELERIEQAEEVRAEAEAIGELDDLDEEQKGLGQMSADELRELVGTCGKAVEELQKKLHEACYYFRRLRSSLDEGGELPQRWRRARRQPKE
jgi:hypothetical protein